MKKTKEQKGITRFTVIMVVLLLLIVLTMCVLAKSYKIIINRQKQENKESTNIIKEIKTGSFVKYDEKLWVILYDDEINGLQMISVDTLKYNSNNFYLGTKDSSITDWSSLITVADLDGNDNLTNFEKAVYSYNNAIDTLNKACESLVSNNENIIDVRCVGSNPTNKQAENKILYKTEELENWPINDNDYKAGVGNNIAKGMDTNYISDFERMKELGINETGEVYWMASRSIEKGENFVYFSIRLVSDEGDNDSDSLYHIFKLRTGDEDYHPRGLRPVVSLKKDIQITSGDGSKENPYIFN